MNDVFVEQLMPLTRRETKRREELEGKVFTLVKVFYVELGAILSEINERRLYKSTHHTFAEYCREILDMAKSYAYRYIDAYQVTKNLLPENLQSVPNWGQNISQVPEIIIPQNESQARALVGLEPEEQKKVWKKVVNSTPDGRITAAYVRATVRELKLDKVKEVIERTRRPRSANKARIGDEFEAAFNAFLGVIQAEAASNWKTTDRRTVVRYLDGLRDGISQNGSYLLPDLGYLPELSNTEKLIEAGLVIYRADMVRLIIEQQLGNGDWVITAEFDAADELLTSFDELMKNPANIRG